MGGWSTASGAPATSERLTRATAGGPVAGGTTVPAYQTAGPAIADQRLSLWNVSGGLTFDTWRLRFQGGLSYQEIGQATGLSVSNVGVQLHTALLRLRSRMQDPRSTDAMDVANTSDAAERSR